MADPPSYYEPNVIRALTLFARPGATAFDVGANAGVYTELLADLVGPAGHVVAFEAVPFLAAALREKFSCRANVAVEQLAACDRSEAGVPFHLDEHEEGGRKPGVYSSLFDIGDPEGRALVPTRVDAVRLDDYCARTGLDPHVMKVDVEGAEPLVFAGARATVERARPTLVFEMWQWSWALGFRECFGWLESLGYTLVRLDDGRRVGRGYYDRAPMAGTANILAKPANVHRAVDTGESGPA